MARLHEELQQHIHADLASECNKMSIRLKLHKPHGDMSAIEQAKLGEAREKHPAPSWDELLDLIDRCRDEMNQCTQPYRRR